MAQSATLMFDLHWNMQFFLPPSRTARGFKHIQFCVVFVLGFGMALVLWMWTTGLPLRQPTSRQMICSQGLNHQLWLEQSGHFTRDLKCIQLSFQTLSTHSKPPGSPTPQQALNVHFNTVPFQKDVELLGFAQIFYECGSFAQICPHVFPGSLPHKDIGI